MEQTQPLSQNGGATRGGGGISYSFWKLKQIALILGKIR